MKDHDFNQKYIELDRPGMLRVYDTVTKDYLLHLFGLLGS